MCILRIYKVVNSAANTLDFEVKLDTARHFHGEAFPDLVHLHRGRGPLQWGVRPVRHGVWQVRHGVRWGLSSARALRQVRHGVWWRHSSARAEFVPVDADLKTRARRADLLASLSENVSAFLVERREIRLPADLRSPPPILTLLARLRLAEKFRKLWTILFQVGKQSDLCLGEGCKHLLGDDACDVNVTGQQELAVFVHGGEWVVCVQCVEGIHRQQRLHDAVRRLVLQRKVQWQSAGTVLLLGALRVSRQQRPHHGVRRPGPGRIVQWQSAVAVFLLGAHWVGRQQH
eukprot:scaffold32331_cov64-Phaeocystis_antarctica.AAC.7